MDPSKEPDYEVPTDKFKRLYHEPPCWKFSSDEETKIVVDVSKVYWSAYPRKPTQEKKVAPTSELSKLDKKMRSLTIKDQKDASTSKLPKRLELNFVPRRFDTKCRDSGILIGLMK